MAQHPIFPRSGEALCRATDPPPPSTVGMTLSLALMPFAVNMCVSRLWFAAENLIFLQTVSRVHLENYTTKMCWVIEMHFLWHYLAEAMIAQMPSAFPKITSLQVCCKEIKTSILWAFNQKLCVQEPYVLRGIFIVAVLSLGIIAFNLLKCSLLQNFDSYKFCCTLL